MLAHQTAPAATSFIIFTMGWYSLLNMAQTLSRAVFTISSPVTSAMQKSTTHHSILFILKNHEAIKMMQDTTNWIRPLRSVLKK